MSRSQASKSRLEKAKGGQSAPTPAIAHDIIPGKFNEHDWNIACDLDDTDDFLGGLVTDLVETSLAVIYQQHLDRQLTPFTVALAKDAMVQIVEWQFLAHDLGETDLPGDSTWEEDTEPSASIIDSWAQGAIPKRPIMLMTPRMMTPRIDQIEEEVKVEESEEEVKPEEDKLERSEEPREPHASPDAIPEQERPLSSVQVHPVASKRAPKPVYIPGWSQRVEPVQYTPYKGRLHLSGMDKFTESLYETEVRVIKEDMARRAHELGLPVAGEEGNMPPSGSTILKLQQGRPPGNKEINYDADGNILSMIRIAPEQLPQHRARIGYKIVDPEVEAANSRLEAMKKGRVFSDKPKQKKPAEQSEQVPQAGGLTIIRPIPVHSSRDDRLMDPLPPSMVDTIVLAAGVIVKEGDRVKRGPRLNKRGDAKMETSMKNLRPVKARGDGLSYQVTEIVDTQSIAVKPLGESKPIPPIATP